MFSYTQYLLNTQSFHFRKFEFGNSFLGHAYQIESLFLLHGQRNGNFLTNHFKGSVWSKGIFLEFPFFAENMIIRSILNLWWHSEILKLILGVVRGMFTKRLKRTRRLLYTVKSDFFEMTALHSKC